MNLTNDEENELVRWITTLIQRGYTPRYCTVRELAEIIRNRRVIVVNSEDIQHVNYDEFGMNWVACFMSRHPQLESARIKCIEAARIKDVLEEQLTKWFEDLEQVEFLVQILDEAIAIHAHCLSIRLYYSQIANYYEC
jgi:hypothetical protein